MIARRPKHTVIADLFKLLFVSKMLPLTCPHSLFFGANLHSKAFSMTRLSHLCEIVELLKKVESTEGRGGRRQRFPKFHRSEIFHGPSSEQQSVADSTYMGGHSAPGWKIALV